MNMGLTISPSQAQVSLSQAWHQELAVCYNTLPSTSRPPHSSRLLMTRHLQPLARASTLLHLPPRFSRQYTHTHPSCSTARGWSQGEGQVLTAEEGHCSLSALAEG
jgi:hypothetical protein